MTQPTDDIKPLTDRFYTPEMAGSGQHGICVECGLGPTPEGHDGCLGTLDESIAMNACCGHGNARMAYIQYWDRSDIRGPAAIDEQRRMRLAMTPERAALNEEGLGAAAAMAKEAERQCSLT